MPDLVEILWQQAEPFFFGGRETFEKWLKGWEVRGHYDGDVLAWITLENGPLFHFASVGNRRPLPLRRICEFLQSIIDRHGYAETHTPREDARQHRFNRRFGFRQIGEDELDIHYRIEVLPHA